MKSHTATNVLLILSAAIILFGGGYKLGEYKTKNNTSYRQNYNITNVSNNKSGAKNIDFSQFWDTWSKLEQRYVDKKKLDPQKMYYGAIKGMVASVEDPYTFFLTPDENKQSKDDLGGKFEGIGAQLGLKDNRIVIVAPIKSSPAEKAGVKAGDVIVKVNDQSIKGWTLPQTVSKIRGPKGTNVRLALSRSNKELTVTIKRDEIHIASVELSYETSKNCKSACEKVAYLKLNQFGEHTNEEWDNAVDDIVDKWNKKQITGMVLDVRDDPGGYLDGAVYTASEFLPNGKLIVKQESTVSESREYKVFRNGRLKDIKVTVLINKGSASASEILAGALHDYKRAQLIGEKSFGKGSVQEALDLQDGAGLHVTVAKWILPNGGWINGKGIEPDVKVENKIPEGETLSKENDDQLARAIDEVTK